MRSSRKSNSAGRSALLPPSDMPRKGLLRRAPGLLEHPLESRYGLHVVELLAREGGEPLDFDAARAQIAAHLQAQVLQRAVGQYIGVLAGDACIEGFAFEGADGALVQ